MKASTRWGSCPFLTLADGTIVGQTRALQRFIARHTGFYPEDFLQAASVDELIDALEDLPGMINSAGRGMEQKEKEAARVALVGADGNAGKILSAIDATIGAFGDGAGHSVGESITLADIATFTTTTHLFSGFFDGGKHLLHGGAGGDKALVLLLVLVLFIMLPNYITKLRQSYVLQLAVLIKKDSTAA